MNLLKTRRAVTEFTLADGCTLANPPQILAGIYSATNGHPCDDCGCKPCTLLTKFQDQDKRGAVGGNVPSGTVLLTNAELGAKHGVSKRQAAKRRIPGTDKLRPLAEGETDAE